MALSPASSASEMCADAVLPFGSVGAIITNGSCSSAATASEPF